MHGCGFTIFREHINLLYRGHKTVFGLLFGEREDSMHKVTLKNFRCFGEEQSARLAPLTLLVGDNSTGKTSFMAMIRALWEVACLHRIPDFKEAPYDFGSFEEIIHNGGTRNGRPDTFEASFCSTTGHFGKSGNGGTDVDKTYCFEVTFARDGTIPVPVRKRWVCENLWIEELVEAENRNWQLRVGTERGSWSIPDVRELNFSSDYMRMPLIYTVNSAVTENEKKFMPLEGSGEIGKKDLKRIYDFCGHVLKSPLLAPSPYASAPVSSKPRRTYDPAGLFSDPEGDHVPMYLANLYVGHKEAWKIIKNKLEEFGRDSGLFDEFTVRHFGDALGSPFQLQVRKFGGGRKGPWHNLIDVGYGVSQVLPVLTELFREDKAPLILLQQPELHLHPIAQASLGSLFCQVAAQDTQLVVETHGDYILDRVRMEVRDNNIPLKPEDVSVLFFERVAQNVHIHSLRIDEDGNILDVPQGYRRFFMEESRRLWGLQ